MVLAHSSSLKRLRYQSWHRGTREMDLILGRFADAALESLTAAEQETYADLLNESDADLFYWITSDPSTPPQLSPLLVKIKEFHSQQQRSAHA